jgi:hypothetical protein
MALLRCIAHSKVMRFLQVFPVSREAHYLPHIILAARALVVDLPT